MHTTAVPGNFCLKKDFRDTGQLITTAKKNGSP